MSTPLTFDFHDRGNWGIILHCWCLGFVSGGFNAFLVGVVAGYLNVSSDIIRGLQNMSSLPNVFSVLMGIVSDSRPIFGYRRRPYMVLGWLISTTAYSTMACMGLPEPYFCVGPDGNYLHDREPCNPDAGPVLRALDDLPLLRECRPIGEWICRAWADGGVCQG